MDLGFSDEQAMLRESVQRFLSKELSFDRRKARTPEGADLGRLWGDMAELGLFGAILPEASGGFGGPVETMIVMEEIGFAGARLPMIGAGVLPLVLLEGLDPSKVEELIAGEAYGAGLFEADSRGDVVGASGCTLARSGDGTVVSGTKILVDLVDGAGRVIVSARDDAGELCLCLVSTGDAGVELRPYDLFDGSRTYELALSEAPVLSVLTRGAAAEAAVRRALDFATVALCGEVVGAMGRATQLTREYTQVRKQFGQALADFQVTQHRIADFFMWTEAARSAVFGALSQLDAAPGDRARAVSACFVEVMENARSVTGDAIHQHGGMGMTEELEVGHHYRRAKVAAQLLGDIDHHFSRYLEG